MRRVATLLVLLFLVGCGGADGEEGTARLWVTRDRGATVLVDAEVKSGQTLMRALAAEADIETRYGGRFLQSLNGIEGSSAGKRDWFWFVNGYEGDRSAAAYRLRDGDIAWWDYRAWEREGEARVVVGAFPEPFLHGYEGKTRAAVVRYDAAWARRAKEIGAIVGAQSIARVGTPVPAGANVVEVRSGPPGMTAELKGESAGDPVRFVLSGTSIPFEHRYEVP